METSFLNNLTTLEYDKSMLEYFVKSKDSNKPTLSLLLLNLNLQISKLSNMHNILKTIKNDIEFIHIAEKKELPKQFLMHLIDAIGCLIDDSINDFSKTNIEKNTKEIKYASFLEFEAHLVEAVTLLLKGTIDQQQKDMCIKSILVLISSFFVTKFGIVLHDYIDFNVLYKNIHFENLATIFKSDAILKIITYFTGDDFLEIKIKEYEATIQTTVQIAPYFIDVVKPFVNAINNQLFENTYYYKNISSCHNVKELGKCQSFMESLCGSNDEYCTKESDCYECISEDVRNKIYETNKEIQTTILHNYHSHEHTIINSAINGSILCQIICKSEILINDDFNFQPDKMMEAFSEFKLTANIDVIESIIENVVTYLLPLEMDVKGESAILTRPQIDPNLRKYFGFSLPSFSLPKLGSIYYGTIDYFKTKPVADSLFTLYLDWGVNQYLIKYPIDTTLRGIEGNDNTGRKLTEARSKYYSNKISSLSLPFDFKHNKVRLQLQPLLVNGNLNIIYDGTGIKKPNSTIDKVDKFLKFEDHIYGQLYHNLSGEKPLSFSCISQLPLKATVNGEDKNPDQIALASKSSIKYIDVIYLFNKYAFSNSHFHLYNNEAFVNILYKCNNFSIVHILPLDSYVHNFKKLEEVQTNSSVLQEQSQNMVDSITPGIIKHTIGKGLAYTARILGKRFKKAAGIKNNIVQTASTITTYDAIDSTITPENYIKYTNYQREYKRRGDHMIYLLPNDIHSTKTLEEGDIIGQINNLYKYKNSVIKLTCDKSAIASGTAKNVHAMIFARDKIIGSYDNSVEKIQDQFLYTTDLYQKIFEQKIKLEEVKETEEYERILRGMAGRGGTKRKNRKTTRTKIKTRVTRKKRTKK